MPERSASEVARQFGLRPLPGEGGLWAPGVRTSAMSSIFYLLTPDGFSAWHRLSITEGWQWLAGDQAELLTLNPRQSPTPVVARRRLSAQQQVIVPVDVWQAARTLGEWTLVACWCAPAYTDDCFTLGGKDLRQQFPEAKADFDALTRHPHG